MSISRRKLVPWMAVLLLVSACSIAAAIYFARAVHTESQPATRAAEPAGAEAVGCMGRIEPEDGVIRVTAPYVEGAPPVVDELSVRENSRVTRGQTLAVLHGRDTVEAAVRESGARVEAARSRLAQAQATPTAADLAARKAEIERLELELEHARVELRRFEALRRSDDISASELETRRTTALTAERSLEEARQKLRGLGEARAAAMEVAESELKVSRAAAERASAGRAGIVVRAPATGLVLKIHAHPGEQLGPEGLLELAKTDRMYVVAEVYETDARRVHEGQQAAITGDILRGELAGTVDRVGGAIARSQIFPTDPSTFADTRVVPVYIRLGASAAAAGLIHGKVAVVIRP